MSTDEPADQNAQATKDAENLLAELQAEQTTGDKDEQDQNSASQSKEDRSEHRHQRGDHKSSRGGRGRGGYRGGAKFKNYKDNIKSDLTTQEKSDDPEAIRKQVEFYFSDSNLPMDKFLLEKVGGSQNHPVELAIIHSFKRMRRFEPFEAIVEALKTSSTLQLTDEDTKVQRKTPLPTSLDNGIDPGAIKVFEDKAMPRSVYVKGFGEEVPSTHFDIEAFFAEYGPTNAIRLRRTDQKIFKGSVFVEFESEQLAQKFLDLDPKPTYHGKDLNIMSKRAYCDQKVEDIKAGKIKAGKDRHRSGHPSNRGGRDRRKRDDEDDRDWRERRDQDRKNGFRDDRRRGPRKSDDQPVKLDDRGVPVVKTTTEAERKAMKEEALAKARAAVETENSKKRTREDEDGAVATDEPVSKKVDSKTDSVA